MRGFARAPGRRLARTLGAMKLPIVVAALLASPAFAADFAARAEAGKAAWSSEVGERYGSSLFPAYQDAMRACLPSSPAALHELRAFSFVAYVAPDGRLHSVEVQPASQFASCFADQLRPQKFAPPPLAAFPEGYPIYIEVGRN